MKKYLIPFTLFAGGCAVDEEEWGTNTKGPQPIMFQAVDEYSSTLFDQDDFISDGQAAFRDSCAVEIEWIYEIEDSVEINGDGTILWRYVRGDDPVIAASGYPPMDGSWDVLFDLNGNDCYSSLTVVSVEKSGGYIRTI